MRLPIDEILPDLIAALKREGRAVVQAPPGAGKTTRIPLALLDHIAGRILLLEPRRLAARAAAAQMARQTGTELGGLVGFRMRGEKAISRQTRIEVVTEGILTRMLHTDPDLPGVGAVIFDEFHERSLHADLGLALTLDIRDALRPDLAVLVMSATLDADPVAALMDDAPILTSTGRSFPVETRWLDRPLPRDTRREQALADLVVQALDEQEGSVLVFLTGEGEIRRVAALLDGRLDSDVVLYPLYGALPFAKQQAALRPMSQGRKLVLATSIAETSLTIDGIRVVVDAGLARRARFDPGTGMSRLMTERVTRAEAEQRRGRAGRTAPGVCYRFWARVEDGALPPFAPPEIERADLAGFALDLALWGTTSGLRLLTAPPLSALSEARALLQGLSAIGPDGAITAHGRAMAALPLHPRLAHMLLRTGPAAAPLAALLSDRDLLSNAPADITLRLRALSDAAKFERETPYRVDRAALARVRDDIRRLDALVPDAGADLTWAEMAALAYPDRIAQRRSGTEPRFVLSGGSGVVVDAADPLAQSPFLVVTDTDGAARDARVRQAIALPESSLRDILGSQFTRIQSCSWSRRLNRLEARVQERLGALVLSDRPWTDVPEAQRVAALCDGLRQMGLPWSDAARRFAARVALVRAQGGSLPAMDEETVLANAPDWLGPWIAPCRTADDLRGVDLLPALRAVLTWDQAQVLDSQAPASFLTPLGNNIPIDYSGAVPEISLRLQELFGVTVHPTVGPARAPIRLVLLSPARRPIQVTMDLPGFWATSYADVRKDMRGQYPKHPWPEDPRLAQPTLRAKPRT